MRGEALRVLLVDDEVSLLEPLAGRLRDGYGYHVDTAADVDGAWQRVEEAERPYDVALIDDLLAPGPGAEPAPVGIDLMHRLKGHCRETECVIFTGLGMDRALDALRAGAYRYLSKPLNLDELAMTIRMAAEHRQLRRQLETTRQEKEWLQTFLEIGVATTSVLELDEVLAQVHEQVDRLIDASCLDVVLYDEDSQTLRFELGYDRGEREDKWERPFTPGRGLTDWVIEHRQPLLIKDYLDQVPPVPAYQRGEASRSWLGVPLIARGSVIGAITVQSYAPDEFDETHQQIMSTVASQVANAIENAGLFREAREGQAYLRSLYKASGSIVSLRHPQQVLQEIVERACDAVKGWRANVVLIDEEGRPQHLAVVGYDAQADMSAWIRPDGISAEVMRRGEPVMIEDVRAQRERVNPRMIADGVGAAACFPLRLAGKSVGVMWVQYRDPRRFSQAEVEALRLYANQAAIAYENARRMREMEHLRRSAERLAGAAGVHEVLQQIVGCVREVLGAASAVIWPYDAVQQTFLPGELAAEGLQPHLVEAFRRDESLPGDVADLVIQREYVAVTDVGDSGHVYPDPSAWGLWSAIGAKAFQGIALREGDETLGVLFVNHDRCRSFSDEDKATLETFAYHAALTLKKARLLDQVSKARDTAKVVAEVSVLEDLQSTLDSVVVGTQEALHCDAVTLYTYDQSRGEFGFPPAMVGVRYRGEVRKLGLVKRDSVIRRILRRDEPHVAEDAPSDPVVGGPFVRREGVRSSVSIPLRVGDRKVGVMFVNYRLRHRFTADELTSIELFAYQAAVAIRNAQLYESERRRANALQALHEASQAVTGTLTLEELLNHVVEQAWRLIEPRGQKMHFGHLALVDGNRVRFVAAYPPEMLARLQERVSEIDLGSDGPIGVTGRVVVTRQPQLSGNVLEDLDYIETDPHVRSQLGVPVKMGDQVIGVISVEHPDYNAFASGDQYALEALAAQAAIAIENARLFRETEHRAVQLAAASEVARDATAFLDVERLLDEAVRRISERFGFYHAGLFLLDEGGEHAVLQAASSEGGQRMLEKGHRLEVGETGIVGFVTRTGEPRIALDVGQDAVHFSNPDLPDTRSEMAVPLTMRGQVIGALDVQSTEVSAFTDGDVATLQIIADHLANAIENARLYEKLQKEARQLALVNQIAAEISATLDLDKILQTLVDELARVMGVEQCAIAIFNEEGEYGDVVAEHLDEGGVSSMGTRIPLRDNPSIDLIRRTKKPVAVRDAQRDPRMEKVWDIMKQRRTRSIMLVPIVIRGEVIGTIGLDAVHAPRDFSREDQWLAETIAHHASIAIQNARRYEELRHTKGLVGARTALAWMGMASSAWRHAIGNYATTSQDLVELAQRDVDAGAAADEVRGRLDRIDDMATKIRVTPITAPLHAEEGVRSVAINDLLRERIKQLQGREPYSDVEVEFDLRVAESTTVRASPDWLRRALDILVENAVEAMAGSAIRRLTVATQSAAGAVQVSIADTGTGVSDEVQERLFRAPIPRPKGSKGLGVGLLMAHTIVQTYGGDIRLDSTGPLGTTMTIWLPAES